MPAADGQDHPATPAAALARLFRTFPASPDWFTRRFLRDVPLVRLEEVVAGMLQQHGGAPVADDAHNSVILRFPRVHVPAAVVLDGGGRIASLLFRPALPVLSSLGDAVAAVAALPGRTAVLVTTNGQDRAAHGADLPLAVGSAFKLAVLRALAAACEAGRLAWDQVVRLRPAWRSLPSGLLQDWPDGTALTVDTLASLMISQSDNTATDALIELLGRAGPAAYAPRNRPFPTTREAFTLKAPGQEEARRRWLEGGETEREAVLDSLAGQPLPTAAEGDPALNGCIEWFFTARELAALLEQTRHLPMLGIQPGPVLRGPWRRIAFKGGEEPGVLNLSALVTGPDERRHCVVATWNDAEALDVQRLVTPFSALLHKLGQDG